jgi:hypothetical protein
MLRRTIVKSIFGAFLSKAKIYAVSLLTVAGRACGQRSVAFGCFLSAQLAL